MLFAALVVTAGLGAAVPATAAAPTPTTITATNTDVTLLYSSLSPLFGVFEVVTSSLRGHPSAALLSTRDFVHFTNITPPGPLSEEGIIGGWSSASFPTPADGWVAEANADYSEGFLFHTTDGGATWQLTRPLWSGSAGTASVSFINAADGWLKSGDIGDGTLTFSATTDGGATWKTLLDEGTFNTELGLAMPSFSDAENGTGVISAPGPVVSPPLKRSPQLSVDKNTVEATTDGGAAWIAMAVPVAGHGVHFFNEPFFSGANGVLAVTVTPRNTNSLGRATVDFDTTTDGGKIWRPASRLVSAAVPKVIPQGPDAGGLPSVSEATARSWWVLAVAPSGKISTYRTADAGRHWVRPKDSSLPLVPLKADISGGALLPASIQAVNSKIAIATVWTNPESTPRTYITLDAGTKWSPLRAPSTPLTAVPAACTASQLSARVGFVQGSSGQWIIPLQFQNISSASCSLSGYPEVRFVNAGGQPVGPPVQNRVGGDQVDTVTLAPGESGVARLWEVTEASAASGPGCNAVTAAAIQITQPLSTIVAGSQGAWARALQVCTVPPEAPSVTPLMAAM